MRHITPTSEQPHQGSAPRPVAGYSCLRLVGRRSDPVKPLMVEARRLAQSGACGQRGRAGMWCQRGAPMTAAAMLTWRVTTL